MSLSKYNVIILAAMPQEIGQLKKILNETRIYNFGDLDLYQGIYKKNPNIKLSIAWSGWGKVSAARATMRLISLAEKEEDISLIIFTGVAGAADPLLSQGDIVLSKYLIQHDMDARPLYKKFVVPSLGTEKINCDQSILIWAENSLNCEKNKGEIKEFGKIKSGLIATGDKFINDKKVLKRIKKDLPDLLAIEMEGAAVAQVATHEMIPWLILRVISDSADESADQTFTNFIENYSNYSWKLISQLLKNLKSLPT